MSEDENNEQKAKSDEFVKRCLTHKNTAIEMLEESLPDDIKALVEISSVIIGKETFIEDDLKTKASDVVLYLKGKKGEDFICFCMIEHQSSCDEWIAFRLMKYNMLLLEEWMINNNWSKKKTRARKIKKKLPIIYNLVCYNGTEKYTAPRNMWDCFAFPDIARKYIAGDYDLINLQHVNDGQLFDKGNSFAVMLYALKHIYDQQERIKAWEAFFRNFEDFIGEDAINDFVYLKRIIEYNLSKMPQEEYEGLTKLVHDELNRNGDDIMRTIAEELEAKGVAKGKMAGIEEGLERGKSEGKIEVALNMLNAGADIEFIVKVSGLSKSEISKLK